MGTYDQSGFGYGIYTNPYGAIREYAQYPVVQQRPQQTQALTEDEIAQLKTNGGEFDISLTQDELLRGFCTHKDPRTGALTLVRNNDNSLTCSICQQTFNEEDLSKENAEAIVKRFIDLLQTIKAAYPDIPVTTARQFFSIIPLAKKVPNLAYFATQNMSKYQNATMIAPGQSPYGFNALGAIMGGAPMGYVGGAYGLPMNPPMNPVMPMPGQPVMGQVPYGYQYQYPYYANAQAPAAPPQVPITPGGNEFGYYGTEQMAPPIAPGAVHPQAPAPAGLNIQIPGVYPAAMGANGQPLYMPNTQPVAPVANPAQPAAPATPVSAPPNTANVSMQMATPVADPNMNQGQPQGQMVPPAQGVKVDANNFTL